MPRLQERNGQYTITIPREYVEKAMLRKGDNLTFYVNENGLELRK